MKSMYNLKTNSMRYLWIAFTFSFSLSLAQNNSVTIGSTNTNNKAVLWLVPNGGQGLLLPSISSATRTAMNLQTTDAGMVVFDTDQNALFYWNGTTWVSLSNNGAPVVTLNGDVTGPTTAAIVQAIQGNKVQAVTPSDQQMLKWNATNKEWEPSTVADASISSVSPSKLTQANAATGQVLMWNGTAWAPSTSTITEIDPVVKAINGIVKSNGTTISAAGASDINTTLGPQPANNFYAAPSSGNGFPSFRAITSADVPTLNQNTTGTANNITATSNSTLTTLSSLSLPTTQLSGTISNAQLANSSFNIGTTSISLGRISASQALTGITSIDGSAAKLTTARTIQTNLASPLSASFDGSANVTPGVAGILPIANGGTGATSVTANTLIKGNAAGTAQTASQLFDNGTNVGIGTTTPQEKLDVNGATFLEQITAPTTTTNRLYNVSGNLFWNGTNISSNGWSLTGNSGTQPATNFIGTTDTASLVFKVNGVSAGKISSNSVNNNLFFGLNSGIALKSSAQENTFFGGNSGMQLSVGSQNTAVGSDAFGLATGGDYNTAIGVSSLYFNTSGHDNTAVGNLSLYSNTTGTLNTGLGTRALLTNKTGGNITAIGYGADVTVDGLYNATAIGANATVGASNALVLGGISGINGGANTNVGIGTTTPQEKLDVNGATLLEQITAPTTTANRLYNVGGNLFWNGTNISSNQWGLTGNSGTNPATNFIGTTDTASLVFKVNNIKAGKVESNGGSTFFGLSAGANNKPNTGNVGIGYYTLANNTAGNYNTASGFLALQSNTIGFNNTASGAFALQNNTTGAGNTASGLQALYGNTTGSNNTASGFYSLYNNTTGDNNTASGIDALFNNKTGSNNTAIGSGADVTIDGLTNATAIGANAVVGASNSLVLGSTGTNVGIGTTTPLNSLDVAGGTVIGSSYAGVNTAPVNGMLVQGSLGIGKTSAQGALDVSGNAYVSGNTFLGGATATIGAGLLMLRAYKGANNYGGMYIDSNGGLPFYGYAQNGTAKVWTYTDAASSNWKLNFGGTDVVTISSAGDINATGQLAGSSLSISGTGLSATLGGTTVFNGPLWMNQTTGNYNWLGPILPLTNTDLGSTTYRWGTVYATNGTIQTSDFRLKENIKSLNYGLKEVLNLKPVSYTWKKDSTNKVNLGLIAQEVLKVVPEAVNVPKDGSYLGMNYSNLVPVLIKSIQEQQSQIEELKSTNKKLEDRLTAIEVLLQNGNGQSNNTSSSTVKASLK